MEFNGNPQITKSKDPSCRNLFLATSLNLYSSQDNNRMTMAMKTLIVWTRGRENVSQPNPTQCTTCKVHRKRNKGRPRQRCIDNINATHTKTKWNNELDI